MCGTTVLSLCSVSPEPPRLTTCCSLGRQKALPIPGSFFESLRLLGLAATAMTERSSERSEQTKKKPCTSGLQKLQALSPLPIPPSCLDHASHTSAVPVPARGPAAPVLLLVFLAERSEDTGTALALLLGNGVCATAAIRRASRIGTAAESVAEVLVLQIGRLGVAAFGYRGWLRRLSPLSLLLDVPGATAVD